MSWTHLRQLDERSIRYFTVVCEEQSVRSAADRLRIAPSAVGRKVKDLETDLGVVLLTRTPRGIKPTALGALFLDYVTQRHANDSAIISRLLETSRLKRGEIKIALGEAFLGDLVPTAIARFNERYPGIKFSLQVMNTEQIIESVENNRTDIGIAFNPPETHNAISTDQLFSDIVCFIPAGWQQPSKAAVSLKELEQYPCALLSREFSARHLIDAAEREAGVRLHVTLETNSLCAVKHFVTAGLGVALLPDLAMQPEVLSGAARRTFIEDAALLKVPVRVLISDLSKDHPVALELLQTMRKHMHMLERPRKTLSAEPSRQLTPCHRDV
jgi:DNA-binding transcriptional LysR family regulator